MSIRPVTKVESLWWYARRPVVWGELGRQALRKAKGARPDERPAATAWCAERAVDRTGALAALGIEDVDVTDLDEYRRARRLLSERGVGVAGAADTSMLYSASCSLRPTSFLETGVAHGLSSLAILLAMEANASGRLISIDMPYRGTEDDSYVGQAVPDELRHRWTLLRVPDRRGIPRAIADGAPFDIVHYDSDKTRPGREFAYPRLWSALRPGGLFLSDDVNDDHVFLEFADDLRLEPVLWSTGDADRFVGALVRP